MRPQSECLPLLHNLFFLSIPIFWMGNVRGIIAPPVSDGVKNDRNRDSPRAPPARRPPTASFLIRLSFRSQASPRVGVFSPRPPSGPCASVFPPNLCVLECRLPPLGVFREIAPPRFPPARAENRPPGPPRLSLAVFYLFSFFSRPPPHRRILCPRSGAPVPRRNQRFFVFFGFPPPMKTFAPVRLNGGSRARAPRFENDPLILRTRPPPCSMRPDPPPIHQHHENRRSRP